MDNEEKRNDENHKLLEEYYKEQNDRIKSNYEAQDKMIMTLSASLLGLIPFIFQNINGYTCLKILIIAFDTLALISTLLSFHVCIKGNKEDLKNAEDYYLKGKRDKTSCWTEFGEWLNGCSLFCFILTLMVLAIMLILNFV